MNNISRDELEKYLDVASAAALAAGVILLENWGKLESVEEKGRAGDLVTRADKESEIEILRIIKRHYPEHGILAEESGSSGSQDNKYLWAIDPLDGTTNYAHGYPIACVSIGLSIEGIPSVGVIYNPFRNELFRGAKGLGASLNHRPIKVSATRELGKSLLVSGFAYDRRETSENNYAQFCYLTHLTQGVRRSGSAALDLADVACGRIDGYWERGIQPWDIAAGILIVEEAGGKVTGYAQNEIALKSGRVIATNGKIHDDLSTALQNSRSWDIQF